ncbi:Ctr copper transporter family-domain-containing protein [Abortiporus biennis]|nr:Ctr copper transporter family-domain-containing protein [Abortiporus biennis]
MDMGNMGDGSSSSSSSTGMSSMSMDMIPWLHFTGGDYFIFKAWRPTSRGEVTGACIGLIVFAILERFVSGCRGVMYRRYKQRTSTELTSDDTSLEKSNNVQTTRIIRERSFPTFDWSYDIPNGLLFMLQMLMSYILMLALMTFSAAFLIAMCIGLGIGEMLFGRMGSPGCGSHAH